MTVMFFALRVKSQLLYEYCLYALNRLTQRSDIVKMI